MRGEEGEGCLQFMFSVAPHYRKAELKIPSALLQAGMEYIKNRYGVEPKNCQELQENAAKMANNMAAFCERMGYRDLEVLISRFQVSPLYIVLVAWAS